MKTIENCKNVIDSRDVIERIDELENIDEADLDNGEKDELTALKALVEQCEGYGDWELGEVLIRRSYWIEYVQELLEDCGDIPKDIPWYIAIDWDKTADNIEADYTTVDFNGVEYLIRT